MTLQSTLVHERPARCFESSGAAVSSFCPPLQQQKQQHSAKTQQMNSRTNPTAMGAPMTTPFLKVRIMPTFSYWPSSASLMQYVKLTERYFGMTYNMKPQYAQSSTGPYNLLNCLFHCIQYRNTSSERLLAVRKKRYTNCYVTFRNLFGCGGY